MTREQEIQERLNAVGCDNAVDADGFKDVGFLEPDASFYGEAFGDITYLLARVKQLEGDVDKYGSLADARATVIEQLKATNAQRDARLVRAGLMMAAAACDARSDELDMCDDPNVEIQCDEQTKSLAVYDMAGRLRALATDDAAIQAAVEE